MNTLSWCTFSLVCLVSTISPGFSTAVVLKNTLQGSRMHGICCVAAHAIGISLYGVATAIGLTIIIQDNPDLYRLLSRAGAVYLLWLGIKTLKKSFEQSNRQELPGEAFSLAMSAREGFLIAVLNPKTALFYLAVFSQFLTAASSVTEKVLMVAIGILSDFGWYSFVVYIISSRGLKTCMQGYSRILNLLLACFMVSIAINSIIVS